MRADFSVCVGVAAAFFGGRIASVCLWLRAVGIAMTADGSFDPSNCMHRPLNERCPDGILARTLLDAMGFAAGLLVGPLRDLPGRSASSFVRSASVRIHSPSTVTPSTRQWWFRSLKA